MQGFCVIGIVIAVGYVAARMRIGGPSAQIVLNRFSFFVSSPCLMFAILSKEPIFDIFHPSIIVAFFSAVLVGVVFLVLNRMFFHLNAPDATIGALNSLYLNSNNIGLPIATYILGNPALVAPILVMQQAIFTPVGLTVLDVTTKGKVSIKEIAKQPLHQPLLIGSLLGIVVSAISAKSGLVPSAEIHFRPDRHDRRFGCANDPDGVRHVPARHQAATAEGRSPGHLHGRGPQEHHHANYRVPARLLRDGLPRLRAVRLRGTRRSAHRPERIQLRGRYNVGLTFARDGILMSTMTSPVFIAIIAALLS